MNLPTVGGLWQRARHLDFLDGKLVDLADRKIFRLLVQMPPRHGKSELVGRLFLAWYLLRHPGHRVVYATNTAVLARRYGRHVRALIQEYGPKYGIYLSKVSSTATEFELVDVNGQPYGGGMVSFGFKTRVTGRGADLLVMDDLLSADDAQSETYRQAAWDYWAADASTRLQPGGVVVEIQTRFHEDDLAGRLESGMSAGGEKWHIVRFPAIAEDADILGRNPGEALWPERYPIVDPENDENPNTLNRIKIRLGPYFWSAEYQQRPTPPEGAIFKKADWRYFKVLPGGSLRDGPYLLLRPDGEMKIVPAGTGHLIITVDLATSEKTVADYTCWCVGRILPTGEILILDVVREHLAGPEVEDHTIALKQQWEPDSLGVEKKGFQLAIIQGIWRKNVPVMPIDVKGDKVGRALPASARVVAHTVYLLQGSPYLTDFVDECAVFPRGAHDDQVDAFAYLGLEAERLGLGDAWVREAEKMADETVAKNQPGVVKRGLL